MEKVHLASPAEGAWDKLKILFLDIKIQHTVFALPFAVMSAFLAAEGMPSWTTLGWIVLCMFGARNAAMAFNRIADQKLDARNPRTEGRALPAGKITPSTYWIFLIASSALFVFSAGMLNRLALLLSPVALAIVFFYSLTKRFTWASHFFLGLALSVAPVGAWVAVREEIALPSMVLGAAVLFWLVGFDIIYACLDVEADRKNKLYSVPKQFGIQRALIFSALCHGLMIGFLFVLQALSPQLGWLYAVGVGCVGCLLVFEHSLVSGRDLSRVNVAFFNVNGIISLFLMTVVIIDLLWV